MGIAQALADLGRVNDGLSILDIANMQCGPLPEFFVRRAELLRRSGWLSQAREALDQAVSLYPHIFWLRGKRIELKITVGEIVSASQELELVFPKAKRERALWHFYRAQVAEANWDLNNAICDYGKAIDLDGEEAWWHHELARVNLLCLQPKIARKHLEEFTRLSTPTALLQGLPIGPSQSHLGQIIDEFMLESDSVARMRSLANMPNDVRVTKLIESFRTNTDLTAAAIAFLVSARQAGFLNVENSRHDEGDTIPSAIPKKIAQFWDLPDVPSDVSELVETWQTINPNFQHLLFNDKTAATFLAGHYSRDVVAAYSRAIVPAQKADLFRLAWLLVEGGYYADVDDRCLARIDSLAAANIDLLLYQEEYGTVGNNFIATVPGHPVIKRALERAVTAINRGDRDLVWLYSGPGVLTRALVEILTEELVWQVYLKKIAIFDRRIIAQKVWSHCLIAYKKTTRHWSRASFKTNPQRSKLHIFSPEPLNNSEGPSRNECN